VAYPNSSDNLLCMMVRLSDVTVVTATGHPACDWPRHVDKSTCCWLRQQVTSGVVCVAVCTNGDTRNSIKHLLMTQLATVALMSCWGIPGWIPGWTVWLDSDSLDGQTVPKTQMPFIWCHTSHMIHWWQC